ncbi:MAG TPA: hypothetical protein VE980_18645 [Pyrinomonadaceae bacterium]|nr:hypothetical protein [Pyrinomonadaceae bacterium]
MRAICIILVMLPMFSLSRVTAKHENQRTATAATAAAASDTATVQLILSSEKLKYNRNDEILLTAMVKNQSLRDVFIYGNLEWGYYASLTLCVRDAAGKEIPPNFIADAITHFDNPEDSSQFVKLLPFHFLGKAYNTSARRLNIQKPGTYSIYAEYHSPISTSKVSIKPFWGKENGIVQSNTLTIEIE